MQIILTRDHVSIPWGFRLKGGAEYNVPLSILKVNEGSPSHYKLECGDVIASIGNYPALNLKHEDALNIIRMFDVSLPLVIQREQGPSFAAQYKPAPSVWKPSSAVQNIAKSSFTITPSQPSSSYGNHQSFGAVNQHNSPSSPRTQSTFANHPSNISYSAYSPSNQYDNHSNNQYSQQQPVSHHQYYQPSVNETPTSYQYHPQSPSSFHQSKVIGSPNNSHSFLSNNSPPQMLSPVSAAPPPPPPPPPPPAPPLPSSFNAPNSYRESNLRPSQVNQLQQQVQQQNQVVPDALLKAMNQPPGAGRKPFTYTPGGLDLSHIRESARVKRHESMSQENKIRQQSLSSSPYPSSSNDYHQQSNASQYQPSNASQYQQSNASQYQPSNASQYQPPNTTQYQPPTHAPSSGPNAKFSIPSSPSLSRKVSASSTNLAFDSSVSNMQRGPPPVSLASSIKTNSTSTANINFDSSVPSTPRFNIPNRPPNPYSAPTGGFNVTAEQLVRPKKDENKDLSYNQSFSFKMLNRWIEESESSGIMVSKKDEEEKMKEREIEKNKLKKSEVIKAIEEEEKHVTPARHSPHMQNKFVASSPTPVSVVPNVQQHFHNYQQNSHQSTSYFPSKNSFEDQTSFNRVPARERDQEAGPSKYRGTNIPSKSFKYLQYLTDNEAVIDNTYINSAKTQPANSSNASFASQPETHQKTTTVQFADNPQELNAKPNHNHNNDNIYTAVPTQTSSSFSSFPNSSVSNLKNNFQSNDTNSYNNSNNNRITVSSFSSAPTASSLSLKKNSNTVTFAQPNYNNDFTLNNSVNLTKNVSSTDNSYPINENTEVVEPNPPSNNVLNNGNDETIVDTLEETSNTLADASALNHTLASSDDNTNNRNENVEIESEPLDEVIAENDANDNEESVPPPTATAAITSTSYAIAQTNEDTVVEPTEFSSSISNNETINTIINLNEHIQLRDDDEQSTVIEDGTSSSAAHNQPEQVSSEVSTTTLHETIQDLNNNGVEEHVTTTIKTTTTSTTSTFETTGQNENNELNQLIKEIETSSSNNNNNNNNNTHEEHNESNNAQEEEHIETSEF